MRTYKGKAQREAKVQHMVAKREKLGVLEALIVANENADNPDAEYVRGLKRRANELRNQLYVTSTLI